MSTFEIHISCLFFKTCITQHSYKNVGILKTCPRMTGLVFFLFLLKVSNINSQVGCYSADITVWSVLTWSRKGLPHHVTC